MSKINKFKKKKQKLRVREDARDDAELDGVDLVDVKEQRGIMGQVRPRCASLEHKMLVSWFC